MRARGTEVEQMTSAEEASALHVSRGTWDPARWITDNDRERSRTSHGLNDLRRALDEVGSEPVTRFLDVGCGYGGLSRLAGEYLGAEQVHGVDIDERVVDEAVAKGVQVTLQDVSAGALPLPGGSLGRGVDPGVVGYPGSFH